MQTTLELPDETMLRLQSRAAYEHKDVKDLMAELIQKGLGPRGIDISKLPEPGVLRGGYIPTSEEIDKAIEEGRDRAM